MGVVSEPAGIAKGQLLVAEAAMCHLEQGTALRSRSIFARLCAVEARGLLLVTWTGSPRTLVRSQPPIPTLSPTAMAPAADRQ